MGSKTFTFFQKKLFAVRFAYCMYTAALSKSMKDIF